MEGGATEETNNSWELGKNRLSICTGAEINYRILCQNRSLNKLSDSTEMSKIRPQMAKI